MRYLRILYFGSDGREISQSPMSSARMPDYMVPVVKQKAGYYAKHGADLRRKAISSILLDELQRHRPAFVGVAFMVCPSKRKPRRGENQNYICSYVVCDKTGIVVRGDVSSPGYVGTRRLLFGRVHLALFPKSKTKKHIGG